jgi:hypothetical protein
VGIDFLYLAVTRKDAAMGVKSEDERWAKFVTEGAPGDCWEWRGALNHAGYGMFSMHRPGHPRQVVASRAALIRAGVAIPPGMCALHRCDNPPCVNPAHLYVGDRKQNAADCSSRGRTNKGGRGQSHWASRYSDAEQQTWRDRAALGESYKSIARSTGASPTHISRVVRGLYRKGVSA